MDNSKQMPFEPFIFFMFDFFSKRFPLFLENNLTFKHFHFFGEEDVGGFGGGLERTLPSGCQGCDKNGQSTASFPLKKKNHEKKLKIKKSQECDKIGQSTASFPPKESPFNTKFNF